MATSSEHSASTESSGSSEHSGTGDATMRALGDKLPVPTFDSTPWVSPKPLSEARVAIVTSAALHRTSDDGFAPGDTSYRLSPADARDLVLGHWSPNFGTGVAIDLNVVFPIDRLEELAAQGIIFMLDPICVNGFTA